MSFFTELKRRNVFKVAVAYLVVAWLIIQVVNAVVVPLGLPAWTAAFFIVIVAAGLPIALLLSWAYEITPDGVKPSDKVDEPRSITSKTGRTIDRIIIVALLLALTYFVMDKQGYFTPTIIETPLSHAGEHSIAVLPFVNMSDDASNEYFSDGISEEILNVLVRVEGLAVASRTSSFLTKGQGLDVLQISEKLGVAHVLEGSVRKHGNRVRITAQLIDARHDIHLWSETYDRELTDIFAIQDEIANAIVVALREALGDDDLKSVSVGVATENMDAYEMYLEGRALFLARDQLGLRHSIELFTAATERDPDFAQAWAGLAAVLTVVIGYDTPEGYEEFTTEQAYENTMAAAEKAIALDPTLSIAYAAMGNAYGINSKFEEAQTAFNNAIYYSQNDPTSYLWRGINNMRLGFIRVAHKDFEIALSLAPDIGIYNDFYGFSLYLLGRSEEALPYAIKALMLGRESAISYIAGIYISLEKYDEAKLAAYINYVSYFDNISDDDLAKLADTYVKVFETSPDNASALTSLVGQAEVFIFDDVGAYFVGSTLLSAIGEYEKINEFQLKYNADIFMWNPINVGYLESAAFKTYLTNIGVVDYWRKYGFPDQCELVDGDDVEGDFTCTSP